jgi:hypothetical protein
MPSVLSIDIVFFMTCSFFLSTHVIMFAEVSEGCVCIFSNIFCLESSLPFLKSPHLPHELS